MNRLAVVAALGVAALGCQSNSTSRGSTPGHERNDCRPDKSCDPGLWCLSDLCVRPPQADCSAVAAQLTSFELGNYAEPEERSPVEAKYAQACRAAYVTKDEGACFSKATEAWTARQCAPRMFPAQAGSGNCPAVVGKMRGLMLQQSPYLADPASAKWFEASMQVMQRSCEEDHWPDDLKACMLTDNLTPDGLQACNQKMPPSLQQTIQQRMAKAMSELRPQ